MDSAATPAKPKRTRAAKKPKVIASHRERMAQVDARAAEKRKLVLEQAITDGYGPKSRTSVRWMGRRTKGLPFSRMIVEKVVPGVHGLPGVIFARHPTRKRGIKKIVATPAMLEIFMPSLPGSLTAAMLGTN